MKVGLLGFGRTGRMVAQEVVSDDECSLLWVARKSAEALGDYVGEMFGFHRREGEIISKQNILRDGFFPDNSVDVVIDFSSQFAVKYYSEFAKHGIKIVSAISHYSMHELEIIKKVSRKTALLYSPNITIGINLIIVMAKMLKEIIPFADIDVIEEHFKNKKGPSGTAERIAKSLDLNPDNVKSIRSGGIVGNHEVLFGLPNQVIRLCHETYNRTAFALGAVYAAKWLCSKRPGLYSMEEIMKEKIKDHINDDIV